MVLINQSFYEGEEKFVQIKQKKCMKKQWKILAGLTFCGVLLFLISIITGIITIDNIYNKNKNARNLPSDEIVEKEIKFYDYQDIEQNDELISERKKRNVFNENSNMIKNRKKRNLLNYERFTSAELEPIEVSYFDLKSKIREKRDKTDLIEINELNKLEDNYRRCKRTLKDESCDATFIKMYKLAKDINDKISEITDLLKDSEFFYEEKLKNSDENEKKFDDFDLKKIRYLEKENIGNDKISSKYKMKYSVRTDDTTEATTVDLITKTDQDNLENDLDIDDPVKYKYYKHLLKSQTISLPPQIHEDLLRSNVDHQFTYGQWHKKFMKEQTHAPYKELIVTKKPEVKSDIDEQMTLDPQLLILFQEWYKQLMKNATKITTTTIKPDDKPALKAGPSHKNDFENQYIGASGPFITLCEDIARQNFDKTKPNFHQEPSDSESENLQGTFTNAPNHHFTGRAPGFPVTGESMKATAQYMFNPNMGMSGMSGMPFCFYPSPQNLKLFNQKQQSSFYGNPNFHGMPDFGVIDSRSKTLGDMMFVPQNFNGNIHQPSSISPFVATSSGSGFNGHNFNQQQPQQQQHQQQQQQPIFCAYMLSNNNGQFTSQMMPPSSFNYQNRNADNDTEEIVSSEKKYLNIPSDTDIIYASYANQKASTDSKQTKCKPDSISCFSNHQCIPKSRWCDSIVDCRDASDETACSCKSRLNENRICDGYTDCPMGEDEMGCYGCDKLMYSCYHNFEEYLMNGKSTVAMCYSNINKCDGVSDCLNGNDEKDCSLIISGLGNQLTFQKSSSEGFLHKNYKGQWYPVCETTEKWAHEACESEIGKMDSEPSIEEISINIPGPFIRQGKQFETKFSDNCNSTIYVKCPEIKCGRNKNLPKPWRKSRPKRYDNDNEYEYESKDVSREKRHDEDERVVGGELSKPMKWPFIVALHKNGKFLCGGVIFSDKWIITAAHCVINFNKHYYEIYAGLLRRSSFSSTIQISKALYIFPHPKYERKTMRNDVALIYLETPLKFNKWVRPICLPAEGKSTTGSNWKNGPYEGTICTAVGWGAIRERGLGSDHLREVSVPILSKCKKQVDLDANDICAGEPAGGRDACQGDSGGPLFCRSVSDRAEWYLAGIVSHGEGCARPNEPGVYTRVAMYLKWIETHSKEKVVSKPKLIPLQICPGHKCVWGGEKCIQAYKRCDRIIDCLGGEDEIGCEYPHFSEEVGTSNNSANDRYEDSDENTDYLNTDGFTPKTFSSEDDSNENFETTLTVNNYQEEFISSEDIKSKTNITESKTDNKESTEKIKDNFTKKPEMHFTQSFEQDSIQSKESVSTMVASTKLPTLELSKSTEASLTTKNTNEPNINSSVATKATSTELPTSDQDFLTTESIKDLNLNTSTSTKNNSTEEPKLSQESSTTENIKYSNLNISSLNQEKTTEKFNEEFNITLTLTTASPLPISTTTQSLLKLSTTSYTLIPNLTVTTEPFEKSLIYSQTSTTTEKEESSTNIHHLNETTVEPLKEYFTSSVSPIENSTNQPIAKSFTPTEVNDNNKNGNEDFIATTSSFESSTNNVYISTENDKLETEYSTSTTSILTELNEKILTDLISTTVIPVEFSTITEDINLLNTSTTGNYKLLTNDSIIFPIAQTNLTLIDITTKNPLQNTSENLPSATTQISISTSSKKPISTESTTQNVTVTGAPKFSETISNEKSLTELNSLDYTIQPRIEESFTTPYTLTSTESTTKARIISTIIYPLEYSTNLIESTTKSPNINQHFELLHEHAKNLNKTENTTKIKSVSTTESILTTTLPNLKADQISTTDLVEETTDLLVHTTDSPFEFIDLNKDKISPNLPALLPLQLKPTENPVKNETEMKKHRRNDKKFFCKEIFQSIDISNYCDRIIDCEDGTDEENCTCRDYLKGTLNILVCDGKADCEDLTDEENCGNCTENEFLCPLSKRCIENSRRCDDNIDCKFKEDEMDCFALTNGEIVQLDGNKRPNLHNSGIFSTNKNGMWHIACLGELDDLIKVDTNRPAEAICSILGFKGYINFDTKNILHNNTILPSIIVEDKSNLENHSFNSKRKREVIQNISNDCEALFIECNPHSNNHQPIQILQNSDTKTFFKDKNQKIIDNVKPLTHHTHHKNHTHHTHHPTHPHHSNNTHHPNHPHHANNTHHPNHPHHSNNTDHPHHPHHINNTHHANHSHHTNNTDHLHDTNNTHPTNQTHDPFDTNNSSFALHTGEIIEHHSWSVDVYNNGKLKCHGILLDKYWIGVSETCSKHMRLQEDYAVAVLGGQINKNLHSKGPHQQIQRIDCMQRIHNSSIVLLHLEQPIHFTRYVLPTFLPDMEKEPHESRHSFECIIITHNQKDKIISIKVEEILDTSICKIDNNFKKKTINICLQAVNNQVVSLCQDDKNNIATLLCRQDNTGWYPRSFFELPSENCDLKEPFIVEEIYKKHDDIQHVIGNHLCESPKYLKPMCTTHRCPLGKCLSSSELCNGVIDCHDGSDELPELCNKKECRPTDLRCKNGNCVPKSKFCDQIDDCGDLTDEPTTCSCYSYLKASDPGKICDGIRNCYDKSDENPAFCDCTSDRFKCGSTEECVSRDAICDQDYDCPNGEDEQYCYGVEYPSFPYINNDGYGQVIEQSYGVWHTKCFPKNHTLTHTEVNEICRKIGHQVNHNIQYRLIENSDDMVAQQFDNNSDNVKVGLFEKYVSPTKARIINKFSPLRLNQHLTFLIKPSRPLTQLEKWNDIDLEECNRLEIKCY